nr:EamA family transporter [Bacillus pinisoli]
MVGLAGLWGASFLFIRIASPAIGPFPTIQGRVTIASAALLIFILMFAKSTRWGMHWKQYMIIGALNAAIPFILIATASLHLHASILAIINSMTPLFTAVIAWKWMKEKLSVKKCFGILVGIVGVIILVGWSPLLITSEVIIAIIFSILSTVSYGFAGVYAKKAFNGVPPLSIAFGQQMGATLLLIPFTLLNLPPSSSALTTKVAFSVICLALLCTAIGYLLYFYLIANVGPTKTLSVTFLVPLFGMIWGIVFLNEQITLGMIAGLTVILSSVFLISDIRYNPKKEKTVVTLRS